MTAADEDRKCPICGFKGIYETASVSEPGMFIKCPQCGEYSMSDSLYDDGFHGYPPIKDVLFLASGMIRRQQERKLGRLHFETERDVAKLIDEAPRRIPDRARCLLQAVANRTPYFGAPVSFRTSDCALAFAQNPSELSAFQVYLIEQGWCDGNTPNPISVKLTAQGFMELDAAKRSNRDSDRVFVAMWFDERLEEAWSQGIRPAITECGFHATRIDREEHNEDINDQIKAEVRRSRFVVADFTGHRPGVYFEAGFALGLGLPVVWLCRKDQMTDAHFDTKNYNHIAWVTSAQIRQSLKNRIIGTIGLGPLSSARLDH